MSLRMSGRQAAMAASQAAATASAESLAPGDVSLAALQQPSGHAHLHRVYNTTHGRVTSHIYL